MPTPKKEMQDRMSAAGFVTPEAAAKVAGVDAATIRNWYDSEDIRGIRSGMFIFVDLSDVKKMLPKVPKRRAQTDAARAAKKAKNQPTVAPRPIISPPEVAALLRHPDVRAVLLDIMVEALILRDEKPKLAVVGS